MAEKIGKYEVIRPLGKGATAVVYLATDPDQDNREVAIKLIRLESESAAMTRRLSKLFQTEINVARQLDHPNIVKVFDAVVEEKRAYMVMEYIRGRPMDEYCHIDRLLPMYKVIDIVFKCCMALDHAYKHGVIHRDIKPANIMLDAEGNPKLTDFGLALFMQKNTEANSTFIQGVGSPAYMSPEQIKSYPLNQKTDLYSMGVVLFQLLTGRLPFRAANHAALMYKIINAETPQITQLNPNLPERLDKVIKKALEKDLYSRYLNGAEFATDLTAVRYQLVADDDPERDHARYETLRKVAFFASFEDDEIWELLRFCVWRNISEKVTLMAEGEEDRRFGIILSGSVEISTGEKAICRLGPGEVVGEMAYLHPTDSKRSASVVTLEPVEFLEVNAAALDLSSEEVVDRFRKALLTTVLERLKGADKALARFGEKAVTGSSVAAAGSAGGLQIEPLAIK